MILDALAAAFRRFARRPARPPEGLATAAQVRHALAVERAVADRTGQPLAVVVFRPRVPDTAAETWAVLARVLRPRLRLTDEAGWLDAHRACAILPFTSAAGAWKVADDVGLLFPGDVPPPVCEVLTYPSGDVPLADRGPRDEFPGRREWTGRVDMGVLTHATNGNGHAATGSGHAVASGRPRAAHPAAPLEPLFHRRVSVLKRTVDVAGAGLGILVLLPLLPAVALAIKLSSRGPVFFKQRRAGWGGRPFVMWKFRTMVADAEARKADLMALNEQDGPAFKIKRDPRVTAVGRFLRGTSIDELPQLWNVLKGDMSLVGPRPLPVAEADRCEPWHRRRLDAVPGLTCIWQVKGRSAVTFDEWVRMDVEYIETQSLGTDLGLILQTVPAMVLRKGAH